MRLFFALIEARNRLKSENNHQMSTESNKFV